MPILDGNVKRVFARLFAIEQYPGERKIESGLWDVAHKLMPKENTQAYTQGIMDLGATLCTRKNPACGDCPLKSMCLAYEKGIQNELPVSKPKTIKPKRSAIFYLYENECGEYFFIKNPNSGIWGGLHCLPQDNSLEGKAGKLVCQNIKHVFTHFQLNFDVIKCQVLNSDVKKLPDGIWEAKENLELLALPAPLKKVLAI